MRNKAKFLLSKKKLHEQYEIVKKISDKVSYSFKTNFEVGHLLEDETDSDFSVHSIESAEMLKDMDRIWFLSQGWIEEDIKKVFEKGIKRFIVDNDSDLKRLLDYIEKEGIEIELLLRIRLKEHTVHTGKYFVYGMRTEQAKEWIKRLIENELITKLGIHFHRKTQNVSEWNLKEELDALYGEDILSGLDYVNIGGGIPVHYKNFRLEVMKSIFKQIEDLHSWLNSFDTKLIIEPGRFLAGPPIVLETNIMNIYDENIIINCSVWNSAMDTFIGNTRLMVEGELDDGEGTMYTIKGLSPDSMDIFRYRVYLPEKKVGEKLVFLNAGAYNFNAVFCNLPRLETVIVD